ncbi:MAG: chemotaxis protein CheW [Myxococcaceae bacterium]
MNALPQSSPSLVPTTAARARQVLSFRVGAEEYGIDILKVQEIRGQSAVTTMPRTAAWVRGAMNLRGAIVPVIDVRARFGLEGDPGQRPVTVVVNAGQRLVGLLVDAVCDVLELAPGTIDSAIGVRSEADFVEALARLEDKLLILVDVEKLVA